MMILVAGPYRSGTGDDPGRMAANVRAMEAYALPLFRAGHVPIVGEWLALPLVALAGSRAVGDAAFEEIFHPIAERLLERCDAVLRVGGPSRGADLMVRVARDRGLHIFHELRRIPGCEGMAEPRGEPLVGQEVSVTAELSTTVSQGLAAYYERVGRRVHGLVEPLSADQLWRRPLPYGNSIGHLLLHLTGNLRYYIGTQIARTGYVRDRPREFADTDHRPKAEVLQEFDDALSLVKATLSAQSSADWQAAYAGVGAEDVHDRFSMFLRCAAHADHHAGQMIYLAKQLGLEAAGAGRGPL